MPINWDDFEPDDSNTAVATPEVNWDDFEPTPEPAYDSRSLAGDISRQVQNPFIEQPDLTPANLGSDEQMRAAYNRERIANRPTAAALADEQAKLREQGDATTWQAGTSWFRGAMQTGLEGTGNAIMSASALAESMLNSGYAGMDATPQEVDIAEQIREERKGMTPSQIREEMERNPVYMAGQALAEVAPEVHRAEEVNLSELSPIPIPGAVDFSLTGAGKTVGGFLPAALMGPAAPLGFGFQSAGEHLHNDYQHLLDQGLSPDDAAKKTSENALASGTLQTALFAALPGPLKKMGDAAIDKLAYEGVKRFVAGRVAQAGKGFVLGATTAAGENVISERPWYEGIGEAGKGLALIDAMMPRGMTHKEATEYRQNAIDASVTKYATDLAVRREQLRQVILKQKPLQEADYEQLHALEEAKKSGEPLTPQEEQRLTELQTLEKRRNVLSDEFTNLANQVGKEQGHKWEERSVEGGWDEQYNGNVAYFDKTTGKIVVNPSELSLALSHMKPGERKAYVESLFAEESIHGLVEDSEAVDFYNNSSALERAIAIRRYTMSASGKLHGQKLSPKDIGHEMIRAKIQQALGHKATEVTATQGVGRDVAKGLVGLENLMFKLRQRTRGGKPDAPVNMQQAMIDTVLRKAQGAKMAATGEKTPVRAADVEGAVSRVRRTLDKLKGPPRTFPGGVTAEQLGRRGPMSPSYQPAPETRKFSESFRDLEGPQKITNSSNNPDMLTTREYGMKMRSVADLDEMLRLNNQARTRLRELKEKGTARTPAEVKEYFALMGRTQFPREMVETATNTGGWSIENERNKPGATALSEDRPLDWKKNPEVEAWLRQHGEEMGIKLPEKAGPESPQYNKPDYNKKPTGSKDYFDTLQNGMNYVASLHGKPNMKEEGEALKQYVATHKAAIEKASDKISEKLLKGEPISAKEMQAMIVYDHMIEAAEKVEKAVDALVKSKVPPNLPKQEAGPVKKHSEEYYRQLGQKLETLDPEELDYHIDYTEKLISQLKAELKGGKLTDREKEELPEALKHTQKYLDMAKQTKSKRGPAQLDAQIKNLDEEIASLTERADKADLNKEYDVRDQLEEMIRQRKKLRDRYRKDKESGGEQSFAMSPRYGMSEKAKRLAEQARRLREMQAQARGEELPEELRTKKAEAQYPAVPPEERVGMEAGGVVPPTAAQVSASANQIVESEIKATPKGSKAEAKPAGELTQGQMIKEHEAQYRRGAVEWDRPSYKKFVESFDPEGWGKYIKPGQLREAWQDAVWSHLINASPERLGDLRKALGLERKYGARPIVPAEKKKGFELEGEQEKQYQDKVLDRQNKLTAESKQRYRNKIVGAIAKQLIGESIESRASLDRREVGIDDVDFSDTKSEFGPYREITSDDIANPKRLNVLLRDQWRGSSVDPETASRRLIVVEGSHGRIYLLSTYNDAGVQRVVEPAGTLTGVKPFRPLNEAFLKQYRPFATILLTDPVKGLRQRFASEAEFMDKIGQEAKERTEAIDVPQPGYSHPDFEAEGTPGLEGEGGMFMGPKRGAAPAEARHPALKSKSPLTEQEARAVLSHIKAKTEAGDVKSKDDVKTSLRELLLKAKKKTTRAADMAALNAYRKIFNKVLADHKDWTDIEIIDWIVQKVFYMAKTAESAHDFTGALIDEFGVRQRAREVDVRNSARGKELTKANIRPPTSQKSFAGPYQTKAAPRAEIEPAEPRAYIPKSVEEAMPAEEAGRRLLKAKDITLRTYRKKGAVLPLEIAGKMAGLTPEQIAKAKEMGYEPSEESEGHRLARGLAMQQHLQETSGVKVSLKNAQHISDLKHGPLSPQYRKGKGKAKERTDFRPFMTSTERVLQSLGKKPIEFDQIKNTIKNKVPKAEWELLDSLGLENEMIRSSDDQGNVDPKHIEKWIKENGPQVAVSTYNSLQERHPPERSQELAEAMDNRQEMEHTFWDELTPQEKEDYQSSLDTLLNNLTQEQYLEERGWRPHQIQRAVEFHALAERAERLQQMEVEGEDDLAPEGWEEIEALEAGEMMPHDNYGTAGVYEASGISPKKVTKENPVHRVDVHLPNAMNENLRPMWAAVPGHSENSNTLGWAAIQFETLPNGEKTAHIFEVQSDWVKADKKTKRHPLLDEYKRLVLKAAIEYARTQKADSFTITDYPTASMTEGHDRGAWRGLHPSMVGEWGAFDRRGEFIAIFEEGIKGKTKKDWEQRLNQEFSHLAEETRSSYWTVRKITERDTRLKIPHEEGMRFNYDAATSLVDRESGEEIKRFTSPADARRYVEHQMDQGRIKRDALDPKTGTLDLVQGDLHKIAKELAGAPGEPVSFGPHHRAFIPPETYEEGFTANNLENTETFKTQREAMDFAGGDGRVWSDADGNWFGQKRSTRIIRRETAPRKNLVFKGEGGEPKTDASGLKYPMPEERSEPYSMFGPQSPSYHVPRKAGAFVSKAIREFGSVYDEWMVDRMVRLGGHVADQAGTLFRHIIDREKEIYGGMTLKLDKARLMAGGTVKAKDTVLRKYLGERVTRVIGQVPSPKMMKAVHWMNEIKPIKGAPFGGTWRGVTVFDNPKWAVPDYVEELAKAAREQNLDVGKILQTVIEGFKAGGLYQRNITALGYDIIRQGRGDMWQKWTAATAKANGQKVLDVREFFREFKELLDTPGVDTGLIEKVNQDFTRKFPKVVTHIKSMGHWQAVLHADLFNYLENSARRASHIVAFREQFPNTPDGKEKLVKAKKAVSVEMGAEGQQAMEAMLRTMQGIPTDDYSRAGLLGPTRTLGQAFRYANNTVGTLMSKMALTGQMVVQPGENIAGSIPVFLGYKNYLRGMAKVRQLYGEQEQRGAVNRAIYDFSWNKNSKVRSAFRIAGNTLSKVFMEQALNELQEASAAATARVVAERIKAGTLTAWEERMLPETFKAMGFPKDEISAMMLGDQQLLDQFERKASAFLTSGNKAISEGSQIGANRLFNSIFRFQSYPMMKANQLRKVATNVAEAFTKGDATAKKRAAEQFARFFFGNAAQGAATVAITNLLFGGFQGLKVRGQEAKDEPVKFLLEAFLSTVSGPLYLAYNAMKYKGVAGYSDAVARLIFPYAVFSEMSDAASSRGRYRDLDAFSRVGEFLKSRTPGFKAIEQGMAMFGLSNKDKKLDAALDGLYRWKRDTFGFDERRSFLTQDNREDFRIAMRKAVDALKSGDADKFQRASQEAELQKSKMGEKDNLSFAGRKVLRDAQGTPLNPDQMDALRKRIGRDAVDRLEYFDLMLDAAGKGTMMPKHDQ